MSWAGWLARLSHLKIDTDLSLSDSHKCESKRVEEEQYQSMEMDRIIKVATRSIVAQRTRSIYSYKVIHIFYDLFYERQQKFLRPVHAPSAQVEVWANEALVAEPGDFAVTTHARGSGMRLAGRVRRVHFRFRPSSSRIGGSLCEIRLGSLTRPVFHVDLVD